MSKILTSLHGKKIGLDHNGQLLVPGGIVSGNDGSQRQLGGPTVAAFWDDFHTFDTDDYDIREGTDSATSAVTAPGGVGADNGAIRITTGDAGTGYAADGIEVKGRGKAWTAARGGLVFECRFLMNTVADMYAFVGFTDNYGTVPVEQPLSSTSSANVITSDAANAVGFMYDTNMADANWWATGVATNTDAVHVDTGIVPVDATYQVFRVEISAAQNAKFFIDGVQVAEVAEAVGNGTEALCPIIAVGKNTGASSVLTYLDYLHVAQNRF